MRRGEQAAGSRTPSGARDGVRENGVGLGCEMLIVPTQERRQRAEPLHEAGL